MERPAAKQDGLRNNPKRRTAELIEKGGNPNNDKPIRNLSPLPILTTDFRKKSIQIP